MVTPDSANFYRSNKNYQYLMWDYSPDKSAYRQSTWNSIFIAKKEKNLIAF